MASRNKDGDRDLNHRVHPLVPALGLLLATVASAQPLVPATFPDSQAVRATWRAVAGAPPPRLEGKSALLPCPFGDGSTERVYWDATIEGLPAASTTLEILLACDRPQAVRRLSLHFKSGAGWWSSFQPLTEPGLTRLLVPIPAFEKEGAAGPLTKATAFRISCWRGSAENAALRVVGVGLRTDRIAVLQATGSEKVPAERAVAAKAAARVSDLLHEHYLGHRLLTDETFGASSLNGVRVLILPYNRSPDEQATARVRAFIKGGGGVIGFHDTHPKIAEDMGVRIQPMLRTQRADQWTGVQFAEGHGGVERLHQRVWNLVPLQPAGGGARAVAWWEDGRGRRGPEVAVVESPRGTWWGQVWKDGDERSKSRLLLEMVARFDRSAWEHAAQSRLETSARRLGAPHLAGLRQRIAAVAGDKPQVSQMLDYLPRIEARMHQQVRDKDYEAATRSGWRLEGEIQRVWAMAQSPRQGEMIGVWDHDGTGLVINDWEHTMSVLARHGVNAYFPNVLWPSKAHFPSPKVPPSVTLSKFGDQLTPCLRAARRHGIEVHAWKICWNIDNATTAHRARMKREDRLMTRRDGTTLPWLSPSHPQNRREQIAAVLDLAARHRPAGIHLDYLRYPGPDADYSRAARLAYEKQSAGAAWPPPNNDHAFLAFRREQITSFLRELRGELRRAHPRIKLSAAVWPETTRVRDSLGQDTGAWLRDDLVDFICPMDYTEDPQQLRTWLRSHAALPNARGRVVAGLGVVSNEASLESDQVIEQIRIAREERMSGCVLFRLDRGVAERILPALGAGVTR